MPDHKRNRLPPGGCSGKQYLHRIQGRKSRVRGFSFKCGCLRPDREGKCARQRKNLSYGNAFFVQQDQRALHGQDLLSRSSLPPQLCGGPDRYRPQAIRANGSGQNKFSRGSRFLSLRYGSGGSLSGRLLLSGPASDELFKDSI